MLLQSINSGLSAGIQHVQQDVLGISAVYEGWPLEPEAHVVMMDGCMNRWMGGWRQHLHFEGSGIIVLRATIWTRGFGGCMCEGAPSPPVKRVE